MRSKVQTGIRSEALAAALALSFLTCGPAHAGQEGAPGFPRAGTYDVVWHSRILHDESRIRVDASDRRAFEALVARDSGTNCRDRQVSIGQGTFSVRMTCDAPDRDFRNIPIVRFGYYTESSIDLTEDITLMGQQIRRTASYRLRPE